MDISQIMFPMMGSPVGMQPSINSDILISQDSTFVNLLDLVSDVQLADSQDPDFDMKFQKLMSENVLDSEIQQFDQAKDQALLEVQMGTSLLGNLSTVGQISPQTAANATFVEKNESVAKQDNALAVQDLAMKSTSLLDAKKSLDNSKVSAESLGQWSHAIANGDLKVVELDGAFEQKLQLSNESTSDLAKNLNLRPSSTDAVFEKGNAAQSENFRASDSTRNTKSVQATDVANLEKLHVDKATSSHVEKSPDLETRDSKGRTESSVALHSVSKNSSSDRLESSSDNAKFHENLKSRSMSAQELLLEKGNEQSFAQSAAINQPVRENQVPAALSSSSELGTHTDPRISRESLDFVADKIDKLKSQGGGSIRIELAPKEMGSIDVKIGMRGGQLQVQIKADNMVAQNSLNQSKQELLGKLDLIAPAQISISSKVSQFELNTFDAKKTLAAKSENFVGQINSNQFSDMTSNLRVDHNLQGDKGTLAPKASVSESNFGVQGQSQMVSDGVTNSRASSWSSQDFLGQRDPKGTFENTSEFRQEKREKAQEQWEERQRKSA